VIEKLEFYFGGRQFLVLFSMEFNLPLYAKFPPI